MSKKPTKAPKAPKSLKETNQNSLFAEPEPVPVPIPARTPAPAPNQTCEEPRHLETTTTSEIAPTHSLAETTTESIADTSTSKRTQASFVSEYEDDTADPWSGNKKQTEEAPDEYERTANPCKKCIHHVSPWLRAIRPAVKGSGAIQLCADHWKTFGPHFRAKQKLSMSIFEGMQRAQFMGAPSRPELPPSTAADGHAIGSTTYTDDISRQQMIAMGLYGCFKIGNPHICPGCDPNPPQSEHEAAKRADLTKIDRKYIEKGEPSLCVVLAAAKKNQT